MFLWHVVPFSFDLSDRRVASTASIMGAPANSSTGIRGRAKIHLGYFWGTSCDILAMGGTWLRSSLLSARRLSP